MLRPVLALVAMLACLVSVPDAQAQSLREALFGEQPHDGRTEKAPPVAVFVSEGGDRFILDRTRETALLRFSTNPEIWALKPSPGPKGDVVYKNDVGEPVLRSSRWGGLTLFSPDRPTGQPAAVLGRSEPIRVGQISPTSLLQYLARASRRASEALNRLVPFNADVNTPGADYLFADSANVTAVALEQLADNPTARSELNAVRQVRLTEGRPPSVRVEQGVLEIKIDYSQGFAGRPSSERISRSILDD